MWYRVRVGVVHEVSQQQWLITLGLVDESSRLGGVSHGKRASLHEKRRFLDVGVEG